MLNRLLHSTALVAFMNLCARVMGFVRDIALAQLFGANAAMDAFFVAMKIPSFMRRLFSDGAFAQAFVPALSCYTAANGREHLLNFVQQMARWLSVSLLIVTLILELAAPWLIAILAPGYEDQPAQLALTSQLLRIMLPYLLLISLTGFAGALLNAFGNFAIPAFTPIVLNVSILLTAFFIVPYFAQPVVGLAWGVVVGGLAQLLLQGPFLWRLRLFARPTAKVPDPTVKAVIKRLCPALLGASVAQIGLLLDTLFASFLASGSITWLYYADRLTSLPLAIVGVAIATVVLPQLTWQQAYNQSQRYSAVLDWGVRWVLLIGIPAALALVVLAEPILISLFQYGQFTASDVTMTAHPLMIYAFSIPFLMLVKVVVSAFYAKQDVRRPVHFALWALAGHLTINSLLIVPLGLIGLALGLTLSSILNAGLLSWHLLRLHYFQFQPGWPFFLVQLGVANTVLVLWLISTKGELSAWFAASALARAGHLLTLVVSGLILYIVALYGLRLRWTAAN